MIEYELAANVSIVSIALLIIYIFYSHGSSIYFIKILIPALSQNDYILHYIANAPRIKCRWRLIIEIIMTAR